MVNALGLLGTLHLAGFCTSKGTCICDRYYVGVGCEGNYVKAVDTWPYDVISVLTSVILLGCAAVTLWSLTARRCCVSASERARMLPLLRNERELAALCNLLACLLRPLWFLNLGDVNITTASLFPKLALDAVLLRLPQCIWMTSYLLMILVWRSIVLSADGRVIGWQFRAIIGLAVITINLVSMPLAVIARSSEDAPDYLHIIGNIILAVAAAGLTLSGMYTMCILRNRIVALEVELVEAERAEGSSGYAGDGEETARAKSVFAAIHSTYRHMFWALAVAAILVIIVGLSATPFFQPATHPWEYAVFVGCIHILVESGAAVHIAVLTFPRAVQKTGAPGTAESRLLHADAQPTYQQRAGDSTGYLYDEEEQHSSMGEFQDDSFLRDRYSFDEADQ
jgi:hypothetical protein